MDRDEAAAIGAGTRAAESRVDRPSDGHADHRDTSAVGDAKHDPRTVFNDKSAILVLRISGDCQQDRFHQI